MERNSLEVSFDDVEKYNQNLATTIIEEYYRWVCFGIKYFLKCDHFIHVQFMTYIC